MTTPELRVAVLGVGMMGAFHAELLSSTVRGARVSVVNDFAAERAAAVAEHTGARVVDDALDAINADDVDAVVIATPGAAHEKQVLACIDRGIPVLCEKPLTLDLASAYGIVLAERAAGRRLVQVGFMRRFDPEYVALHELIASGGVGNPLLMHCVHRNADVAPGFDSAMMINDSVVHEVDVTRFLLGEEVVAVTVRAPTATKRAPLDYHDPMMVLFETASGRHVDVEIFVRTGIGYEVRTEVVGEDGSAMIGTGAHLVHSTPDARYGSDLVPSFLPRFAEAYRRELQAWVDAAVHGTVAGAGSWDGYAALAVCGAGVHALRTSERVDVQMEAKP